MYSEKCDIPTGVEAKASPIEISLTELHDVLSELDHNIDMIVSKTALVRSPQPECPPTIKEDDRPACTSMVRESIMDATIRAKRFKERLITLYREIEL